MPAKARRYRKRMTSRKLAALKTITLAAWLAAQVLPFGSRRPFASISLPIPEAAGAPTAPSRVSSPFHPLQTDREPDRP
jgi:hypothetical protein